MKSELFSQWHGDSRVSAEDQINQLIHGIQYAKKQFDNVANNLDGAISGFRTALNFVRDADELARSNNIRIQGRDVVPSLDGPVPPEAQVSMVRDQFTKAITAAVNADRGAAEVLDRVGSELDGMLQNVKEFNRTGHPESIRKATDSEKLLFLQNYQLIHNNKESDFNRERILYGSMPAEGDVAEKREWWNNLGAEDKQFLLDRRNEPLDPRLDKEEDYYGDDEKRSQEYFLPERERESLDEVAPEDPAGVDASWDNNYRKIDNDGRTQRHEMLEK